MIPLLMPQQSKIDIPHQSCYTVTMNRFRILNFRKGDLAEEYIVLVDDDSVSPLDYARPGFTCVAEIKVDVVSGDANTLPTDSVMLKQD